MKLVKTKQTSPQFTKLSRQTKVAKILAENPYIQASEIAEILRVAPSTIYSDINEINKVLHQETMISAFIHRDRILKEINNKKRMCSEKLAQCRGATAGTRWIEEWTKLTEKECKILGIYSPDRKIVAHIDTAKFSKEEKDEAIKAALLVKDVVDVSAG